MSRREPCHARALVGGMAPCWRRAGSQGSTAEAVHQRCSRRRAAGHPPLTHPSLVPDPTQPSTPMITAQFPAPSCTHTHTHAPCPRAHEPSAPMVLRKETTCLYAMSVLRVPPGGAPNLHPPPLLFHHPLLLSLPLRWPLTHPWPPPEEGSLACCHPMPFFRSKSPGPWITERRSSTGHICPLRTLEGAAYRGAWPT